MNLVEWLGKALENAAAPVVVVALFLSFLIVAGKWVLSFLGNHMRKHTEALDNLVTKTNEMCEQIKKCPHSKEQK